jgi:biotin carboxyl carrier protein
LKLRVEVDGQEYTLDLRSENGKSEYKLIGAHSASGIGSVAQISPDIFSVLLDGRSITVHITSNGESLEVWTPSKQHVVSVTDLRDRSGRGKRAAISGPLEVRAQMPGKVIKLLVEKGVNVQAGQGLIVVEAMKMQNEMKSPKDGMVSKINVAEGATVSAGQTLIVVE